MKEVDITPSTMTTRQIKEARPVGAMAQVAAQHGDGIDTDTIGSINPVWLAMAFKRIRKGHNSINLKGCLLPGSPELNDRNSHLQAIGSINPDDWEGWLIGKPVAEHIESALVPEGEGGV